MPPPAPTLAETSGDRFEGPDTRVATTLHLALSICGMAIVFAGMVMALSPQHADQSMIGWLVACVCASVAVTADARGRRVTMSHAGAMWLFLCPVLAGPVYLVRTRGLRGLGWCALFAVAWAALTFAGGAMALVFRLAR